MLIFIISGSFQNEAEIVKKYTSDTFTDLEVQIFDLYDFICKNTQIFEAGQQEIIEKYIDSLLVENEKLIVIGKEIGCGIVPINPKERLLREINGRLNCYVAGKADKVVRVIAGIEQVIKG